MGAAGVLHPRTQLSVTDPLMLAGPDWRRRLGGQQAAVFFTQARPAKQQQRYDRWVNHWLDFNRWGDGQRVYDPLFCT
jgi:hypothetical protein